MLTLSVGLETKLAANRHEFCWPIDRKDHYPDLSSKMSETSIMSTDVYVLKICF